MRTKTPGKLNFPPDQSLFVRLPLIDFCGKRQGVYYRLHPLDKVTGKPYDPIFFGRLGCTRFDHALGPVFYALETVWLVF
jgi:hypothetical protein